MKLHALQTQVTAFTAPSSSDRGGSSSTAAPAAADNKSGYDDVIKTWCKAAETFESMGEQMLKIAATTRARLAALCEHSKLEKHSAATHWLKAAESSMSIRIYKGCEHEPGRARSKKSQLLDSMCSQLQLEGGRSFHREKHALIHICDLAALRNFKATHGRSSPAAPPAAVAAAAASVGSASPPLLHVNKAVVNKESIGDEITYWRAYAACIREEDPDEFNGQVLCAHGNYYWPRKNMLTLDVYVCVYAIGMRKQALRVLRRARRLQDTITVSCRTDDWREERAAVLHSLALAAACAGDDATVEGGLKDAIAAIESLDSAAARQRMHAQLQDLFNNLSVVYRRSGNFTESALLVSLVITLVIKIVIKLVQRTTLSSHLLSADAAMRRATSLTHSPVTHRSSVKPIAASSSSGASSGVQCSPESPPPPPTDSL
eukprot:19035-Heterococcus_DN1.PRE.2